MSEGQRREVGHTAQRFQLAPSLAQVDGVETLLKPAIYGSYKLACPFDRLVPAPQAGEAGRGAQLERQIAGCGRGSAPRRSRPRPRPRGVPIGRAAPRRGAGAARAARSARPAPRPRRSPARPRPAPSRPGPASDQGLGQHVGVDREILGRAGVALDREGLGHHRDALLALAGRRDGPAQIQPSLGQVVGETALDARDRSSAAPARVPPPAPAGSAGRSPRCRAHAAGCRHGPAARSSRGRRGSGAAPAPAQPRCQSTSAASPLPQTRASWPPKKSA